MNAVFRYKIDHLLFWVLTIGFHAYTHSNLLLVAGTWHFILELIIRNGLLALVIYTNLHVTIPKFGRQKVAAGISIIILTVLGYTFVKSVHDTYLHETILNDISRQSFLHNSFYNLSIVLFYLAFAITLHLSKQWFLQRELLRRIEVERLNTELEYLKAQINPHFLFNSLNTVFFQIDKDNEPARETLSRFSEMLRYQLYECNGKEIAIEKEIQYLENYVELQRMRKDEHYTISYTCDQNLKNFTIPPLLLLPFIENAFKHGSHYADRQNEIRIELQKPNGTFRLTVYNTHDARPAEAKGGIGLKNVKRRLELLYPDTHELQIERGENFFRVTLTLKIGPL